MLAAHTSDRIPGVESRPSPSTGGQGVAQPQQESPQREPGRACAPAVPPSSCSRDLCLPLGPLPSPGSGHFPSLHREVSCLGWSGDAAAALLLCHLKGSFSLSPVSGDFTALCHLLGQRFNGIFKHSYLSSCGTTAEATQEKLPEAPPAQHH